MPAPAPNTLIGITHTADLRPVIREPRVLKVGIGIPKGRASYVYIHNGRWQIRYGEWENEKLVMVSAIGPNGKAGFANRDEAHAYYVANQEKFAISNRPQKIPFFTFTKRRIVEVKGKPEEVFEPDWDTIEAHGEVPREIDVVFMTDNPLFAEYQAWSATELKCHGDGVNALRVLSLGNDKWLGWKDAADAKEKYFAVSECWTSGLCPIQQKGECKPTSVLTFQLANSIRLGATAYFTSTSIRSAQNLFSSLSVIRSIAERAGASIANTPLKLVLAPFRTNHDGKAATQYGVSLELRSQDVQKLRALLAESAWKPSDAKMLTARIEEDAETVELTASAMTAEFTEDPQFEDEGPIEREEKPAMAAATDRKTDALAEKIKAKKEKIAPVSGPEPESKPEAPTPTEPPQEVKPNPWPDRVRQTFHAALGNDRFLQVLVSLGLKTSADVNAGNYKQAWDAMTRAKDSLPGKTQAAQSQSPPASSGDLF